MNKELTLKFKDMSNRIIHCINDFIENNIENPSFVESKLLLINNYIIDILSSSEITSTNIKNFHTNNKDYDNNISKILKNSRDYEKRNKTLIKNKSTYFSRTNIRNDRIIENYNNNKNNFDNQNKIIILKGKLKNGNEKNKIKDSFLKRLIDMQKEVVLYEFLKTKERKSNSNNNSKYFTVCNSCKNTTTCNFKRNKNLDSNTNSKMFKNSMSQCDIGNKENNDENNYDIIKFKYDIYRKKQFKKKNLFKYDFCEIKKSMEKKLKDINFSFKNK